MNRETVRDVLSRIARLRFAVVGDLMLDRYIVGRASRISPEAPVPIVHVREKRTALGGAANVLRNLASLGARCTAFGVVGDDRPGNDLLQLCDEARIGQAGIVVVAGRPTTVKTRVLAEPQQVVRIDEEDDSPLSDTVRQALWRRLEAAIRQGEIDAIIIEDYNKGAIDQRLGDRIVALAREHGLMTALDPHPGNDVCFRGLTLMTPNRAEAFALAGAYYRGTTVPLTEDVPLLTVGQRLMNDWAPDMLLVTLGPDGMALFRENEPLHHIGTVAREVFDVSGAGDTVIATFTAALLAGLGADDAVTVANHAAGVVVGKVGTVPIERDDLLASFPEEV